jgi:hypothetical protein
MNPYAFPIAPWAIKLIELFFEMYPPQERETVYRRKKMTCMQYWKGELTMLFSSRIDMSDAMFQTLPYMDYLIHMYGHRPSLSLLEWSQEDRKELLKAYCCLLGMHQSIFPFEVTDFE